METSTEIPESESTTISFYHRAIVASILIAVSVIGLFGNALVLISVVITKKLRTITNVLVANLALADFLTCCCMPFQAVGLLSKTRSYPLHSIVCTIVAGVITISLFCSIGSLVAISWLRWYVITKYIRGHQGMHAPKKIAIVVIMIWIVAVAMIVPPALGVGTLGYSVYYSTCSLTGTNPLELFVVMSQGLMSAIALVLTLTFYALIWRHVLRHNKKFRDKYAVDNGASSTNQPRPSMIKTINRKEIQITKNLFMVVCVFIICFLANSVNFFIPGASVFTLYSVMILLVNSVVNPMIYGLKHPNFQEVFKRLLCCHRVPLGEVKT